MTEELRARSPHRLTARQRAERFEVSVRTMERDISALQQAGVPIWAERGRAGGYGIDPTMTLPPTNLSPAEAMAVVLALASLPMLPYAAAGRRATQMLLAVMRSSDAEAVRDLSGRVRLTPPALTPIPPAVARAVEDAVAARSVLVLDYLDRDGERTHREVEVHGLHLSATGWYLIGWCRLRDDSRVFRLDRIEAAAPTGERAPARDVDAVLDVPFTTSRPDLVE
ncbi:YafY family protein [soil metagenome]